MKLEFYRSGDHDRLVGTTNPASEPYRTAFRRDYARVIHSPAFRRLQRKTQLFPGDESDFFRNRLTHSLEVAQIAKSIAIRLNYLVREKYGAEAAYIDTDLVELAGLAHDLGHPPFGHTGEFALDERMRSCGGYEGNAQTLRILSRLEKRQTVQLESESDNFIEFDNGHDLRAGLNLCFRSLAAILKYDHAIPLIRAKDDRFCKGYYSSEEQLVEKIKRGVLGAAYDDFAAKPLQVVEMQIMDIADDIAYSTYDFEDALKAGFGSPLDLLQQMNNNLELRDAVARKLFRSRMGRDFPDGNPSVEDVSALDGIQQRMVDTVLQMLMSYLLEIDAKFTSQQRKQFARVSPEERALIIAQAAVYLQKLSNEIANNGYVRAQFTSDMVGKRIQDVGIEVNEAAPCLSEVTIPEETRFEVDVLKHVTYELHIKSPRLKLIEYRGKQIIGDLFDCFDSDKDGELLPHDWRSRVRSIQASANGEEMRKRLICDFIAGMTDAYALDVYSRLKTTNPSALFRPF